MGADGANPDGSWSRMLRASFAAALLWLSAATFPGFAGDAAAGEPVDLEIVLIVDASASISGNVLEFQLQGHAAAFRDDGDDAAITSGPIGSIAVTLAQFSDPTTFSLPLPWPHMT